MTKAHRIWRKEGFGKSREKNEGKCYTRTYYIVFIQIKEGAGNMLKDRLFFGFLDN